MDNTDVMTATTPSEHTQAADGTAPGPEPSNGLQEDAFRLPVKFNKQDYHLSLEEATAYAQKGMKFDTVEPMLDQLRTLAQRHGLGVREMVEELCREPDEVGVEQRLAEEFCQLQAECPQLTAFDAVPETAVRMAVEEGLPLLDAYLRCEHRERMRAAAAGEASRRLGDASCGTQHTALGQTPDPAVEAMLAGVRG